LTELVLSLSTFAWLEASLERINYIIVPRGTGTLAHIEKRLFDSPPTVSSANKAQPKLEMEELDFLLLSREVVV
jgi:hypothetical protein